LSNRSETAQNVSPASNFYAFVGSRVCRT